MESSRSGPVKELCSKILTRTDIGVRLSFPTASMREHFRLEGGTQSLDFQVRDRYSKVWTFRLYTRKNDDHPKPVLTTGWLDFVKKMGLKVGDKVWTFLLYIRKNNRSPKAFLTKGWLDFVKRNGLKVGDKVIFLVHGNFDELGIQVQRNIKILGHKDWADL